MSFLCHYFAYLLPVLLWDDLHFTMHLSGLYIVVSPIGEDGEIQSLA